MEKLISSFTAQLADALKLPVSGSPSEEREWNHVVITGMGGSGIGGRIAAQFCAKAARVPVLVNNDYTLPSFVREETLLIASSYSGNTEETLSAMDEAVERKATVACITSGGDMYNRAVSGGFCHIRMPGGMPPRAAFGYSLTSLLHMLHHFGIISDAYRSDLGRAKELLDKEEPGMKEKTRELSKKLHGKLPVIYSDAHMESVALRFRQQINENSKMLCWHHVFPELNHNELVGWKELHSDKAVIILRNDSDHPRTQKRMEITKGMLQQHEPSLIEIPAKGNSQLERALFLIHLCDWCSFYLAELNGVDAMEVEVIDRLKSQLARC